MVERIVLALNGGTGSRAALDWMIKRSGTIHVSLEFTTVIDLARLPTTITKDWILPAYEQMLMDAASRVRRDAPTVQMMTSVRRGAPRQELLISADDADLLVIGAREVAGSLYGTLRHQIAAGASCPLVILPTDWTPCNGSVVVGVDDDDTSQLAVDFAAQEAERQGRVLHFATKTHRANGCTIRMAVLRRRVNVRIEQNRPRTRSLSPFHWHGLWQREPNLPEPALTEAPTTVPSIMGATNQPSRTPAGARPSALR